MYLFARFGGSSEMLTLTSNNANMNNSNYWELIKMNTDI